MGNTPTRRVYSGLPEYYLISGGESRDMIVWDAKEQKICHKIKGAHSHTICDIVELGDDKHVVSSSFDSTIKVWDMKSMKHTRTLKGHKDAVRKICIFGDLCLSASKDNTIKVWNVTTGELVDTYVSYCNGVSDIQSIDSNTIATTNNTAIRLWDVNKKKLVQSFTTHIDWVIALAFDKEKDVLFSASWDRKICLWDPRIRGQLVTKPLATIEHVNQINSMLYAPMKDWILVGDQAGCVSIYDMRMIPNQNSSSKKKIIKFKKNESAKFRKPVIHDRPHSEVVFRLCWMEGHKFASCAADKTIRLYDLTKLTATGYILKDKDPITTILFFPDTMNHVGNFRKLEILRKMKKKMKKEIKEGEARILREFREKEMRTTFRKYKNLDVIPGVSRVWRVLSRKLDPGRIMEEKVGILYCTAVLLSSENKKGLVHEKLGWNHVKISEEGKVILAIDGVGGAGIIQKTWSNVVYAYGVMIFSILWDCGCDCDREENQKKEENAEFDYHHGKNCTLRGTVSENERNYPKVLIDLIKDCWNEDPKLRPASFEVIYKTLMSREIIEEWKNTLKSQKEEEEEEGESEGEEEEELDDSDFFFKRALKYYAKGNYEKTVEFCNKSIESKSVEEVEEEKGDQTTSSQSNEKLTQIHYRRGRAYQQLEMIGKAIEDFTEAIRLSDGEALYHHLRGHVYLENEEPLLALEDFNAAISSQPNNFMHYEGRGETYHDMKKYKEAASDFSKSIELDPVNGTGYRLRASVYVDAKEYKKALSDIGKASEIHPEEMDYWLFRVEILLELKDYQKVVDECNVVIENMAEEEPSWYMSRGIAWFHLGGLDNAKMDAEKAIELDNEQEILSEEEREKVDKLAKDIAKKMKK